MATKISGIEKEFILKSAITDRLPIRIHNSRQAAKGMVLDIGKELMTLETVPDWVGFQSWDKVSCYLNFRGHSIGFKTKIRKIEGRRLYMNIPETAYRGLERKYVRVPAPRDMDLKMYLQDGDFSLNFPVCEEYSAVDLPQYNDAFDVSSLNSLVESFRKRVGPISSENRTIMFRKRQPESFEEQLITKLGKILYLPSTRSGLPTSDPYPEGRLITKAIEEDYEGTDFFLTGSKMERYLAEKGSNKIHSEIWVPVLYYQYVVGYVYLCNRDGRRVSFDLSTVELAFEFSRILAYFLRTHNYFNDKAVKKDRTPFEASVVDISASGLLLAMPQDKLKMVLKNQSSVELEFRIGGKTIRTQARIMRRYTDSQTVYYGLVFSHIKNEYRKTLYEYLYNAEFDPENKEETEMTFALGEEEPLT
jgi:hypothetical protein